MMLCSSILMSSSSWSSFSSLPISMSRWRLTMQLGITLPLLVPLSSTVLSKISCFSSSIVLVVVAFSSSMLTSHTLTFNLSALLGPDGVLFLLSGLEVEAESSLGLHVQYGGITYRWPLHGDSNDNNNDDDED